MIRRSRRNGRLYEFEEPEFADLRSEVLPQIVQNWEWAWTTDIETDKQRALELLSKQLG